MPENEQMDQKHKIVYSDELFPTWIFILKISYFFQEKVDVPDYERGKRRLRFKEPELGALADALRWSLDDLMEAMAASGSSHD